MGVSQVRGRKVSIVCAPITFEFFIGGHFGPSYEFSLKSGELSYKIFADQHTPRAEATIKLSTDEWLLFKIAVDGLDIWNWETRYEGTALDGTSWSLRLEYAEQSIISSGSNAYPGDPPEVSTDTDGSKRFDTFLKIVNDLLGGLEFSDACASE